MANFKYLDEAGLSLLVEKIKGLVAEAVGENAAADALLSKEVEKCFDGVEYKENKIVFKHGDEELGEIDATDFIKDGMVKSVEIEDGKLVIKFNEDGGEETIELALTDIFNPENYYTKEETDEAFVKWGEYQGRKVISLENYDNIAGKDTNGQGHNLVMLSQWDVADFGAKGVHMNLNTKDTVTINDKEVVATLTDIENVVKYSPFKYKDEERKSIVLDERDTISSMGVNIAMVSTYEGLDFPVVELGGQKAAMVLNSNEQPVKVEVTENGKREQYEVITSKNGVTWTDSDMNDGKKFILLENADMIMGKINPNYTDITTDQGFVSLIQVNKWNCLDFGNYHLPLVFSVPEGQRPVVQAKNAETKNEVIAYMSDITALPTYEAITEDEINAMFE